MRMIYGTSAIVWSLYLVLAASWRPQWVPDISLFRRITTYEDPLTGLTRSIYAAAHGELMAAFKLNPLFPVYVLILLYLIAVSLRLAAGRVESVKARPILLAVGGAMALTIVVKLVAGLPMRE